MVNYGYVGEYELVQFLLVHDVNEAALSQWTSFFMRLEDNPCWCSDDFHQTFTILREMNGLTYSTSATRRSTAHYEWTVRELYCIRSSSQATAPISLLGQGCLSD
jgi:hypothetical protein